MSDLISRKEAQECQRVAQKRRYTFGNDEFSLEAAYHDCKLVFDGITDDDSFQEADTGLILYYANEIIYALQETLEGNGTNALCNDTVSRQAAIDAVEFGITYAKAINKSTGEVKELFKEGNKALNEAVERLKELPSAEPRKGKWIWNVNGMDWGLGAWTCSECKNKPDTWWESDRKFNPLMCSGGSFCGNCGADMRGEKE